MRVCSRLRIPREAFDAEIVRRKRTGELARLDAGKEPPAEFGEKWWRLHAEPNLARSTLKGYASIWDAHVLPRLASIPLSRSGRRTRRRSPARDGRHGKR